MRKTLRVALLALLSALVLTATTMAGPSGPKSGDPDGPQITPPSYECIVQEPLGARRGSATAVSPGHLPTFWNTFLRIYLRWNGIRLG